MFESQNNERISRLLLETQASNLLQEANDVLPSKLKRQADLLVSGVAGGALNTVLDRISSPIETGASIGLSYTAGYGLARLQNTGSMGRLGTQVVGLAMLGAAVKDLFIASKNLPTAIADTWNDASPEKLQSNKKIVAETLAPFLVDSTIYGAAGFSGARYGKLKNDLSARINASEKISNGVVLLHAHDGSQGSGFAVRDNRIVSAFHVVENQTLSRDFVRTKNGHQVEVVPEIALPQRDLVLFRATNSSESTKLTPLKIANANALEHKPIAAVGFRQNLGNDDFSLRISPTTKVSLVQDQIMVNNPSLQRIPNREALTMIKAGHANKGMSGGPLLDKDLAVVGVNHSAMRNGISTFVRSQSIESKNVETLLALADKQSVAKTLTLRETADLMAVKQEDVVRKLFQGKIQGYMIPVAETNPRVSFTRSDSSPDAPFMKLTSKDATPTSNIPVKWEWRILENEMIRPK